MDWKKVVRTVAPTLATALGSPLAGAAVNVLANTILGKDGTQKEVEEAVLRGISPEVLAAIKKADQDFAARMKELDIDLEKTYLGDIQDARRAHAGMPPVFYLGCIILGTFAAIVAATLWGSYALMTGEIKPADMGLVATVSGLIGAVVGYAAGNAQQVIGFYFGSSSSSEKKTEAMSRIMDKSNLN